LRCDSGAVKPDLRILGVIAAVGVTAVGDPFPGLMRCGVAYSGCELALKPVVRVTGGTVPAASLARTLLLLLLLC